MKLISYFFRISALCVLLTSCVEDEIKPVKPKTYWEYTNFISKGLVAYYTMNGDANDSSKNLNHGILHGTTPSVDRFGDSIGALRFDGVDDYIEIPKTSLLDQNEGTICFWARVAGADEGRCQTVLSKTDSSGNGYFIHSYHLGYGWNVKVYGLLEQSSSIDSDRFWTEKKYFFIGVTFSSRKYCNYFQGQLTRSFEALNKDVIFNNDCNLMIGKSQNSSFLNFKGDIDELLIYNRVLTDEEIKQLYQWTLKE